MFVCEHVYLHKYKRTSGHVIRECVAHILAKLNDSRHTYMSTDESQHTYELTCAQRTCIARVRSALIPVNKWRK